MVVVRYVVTELSNSKPCVSAAVGTRNASRGAGRTAA
ncbi:hypothetical protein ACP70R_016378 [Stipagrostis hirtigluma subsp. patula]